MEHYRGNEEFVKRVFDLMEQCERRRRMIITPFFSPDQIAITKSLCGHQIVYEQNGGYEGAERCRFAFLPFSCTPDFKIVQLKASYFSRQERLTHRDVLGAVMNLGLERDKIGDILVQDDHIYVFCDQYAANYIISNLMRIKRVSVHFEESEDVVEANSSIRYAHHIVSSLRLDALVASLAKVSRAQAQSMIMAGQVKVNHVPLEQTSYLCNNNSAISIRGYGRYHFKEVLKKTKKDHFVIDVGRYE